MDTKAVPTHNIFKMVLGLFMGHSPMWYKQLILAALVITPLMLLLGVSKFVIGWAIVAEFIVCLAMARKCYPLLPGGLVAAEAIAMGLTDIHHVYKEAVANFNVILLLVFVVAGVYFLRDWLEIVFRKILIGIKSKVGLALAFGGAGTVLSAFLDALTVMAAITIVLAVIYELYNKWRSAQGHGYDPHDEELTQFRNFLATLVMHGAFGTMFGGVITEVGEPQNQLIAEMMRAILPPEMAAKWDFVGFFLMMAVITIPNLIAGLLTIWAVEKIPLLQRWFGYGAEMPAAVRRLLEHEAEEQRAKQTPEARLKFHVQTVVGLLFVVGLGLHIAPVGLLGLGLIILATNLTGVSEEEAIGKAFTTALPFTALLVTFFAIVALIVDQRLLEPIVQWTLSFSPKGQLVATFSTSGGVSTGSDNVLVAGVFMNGFKVAYEAGLITPEQLQKLAVAVNTGTNIPSVATPNGQAAFLFILTSPLATLITLGYGKMFRMAIPFTIVCTSVSLTALWLWL